MCIHNNDYEIIKTKSLTGKDLHQSKNDYGRGSILYSLFLALKTKFCIVIDENDTLSRKTSFRGYDENLMGLNFENFPEIENGAAINVEKNLKQIVSNAS